MVISDLEFYSVVKCSFVTLILINIDINPEQNTRELNLAICEKDYMWNDIWNLF